MLEGEHVNGWQPDPDVALEAEQPRQEPQQTFPQRAEFPEVLYPQYEIKVSIKDTSIWT